MRTLEGTLQLKGRMRPLRTIAGLVGGLLGSILGMALALGIFLGWRDTPAWKPPGFALLGEGSVVFMAFAGLAGGSAVCLRFLGVREQRLSVVRAIVWSAGLAVFAASVVVGRHFLWQQYEWSFWVHLALLMVAFWTLQRWRRRAAVIPPEEASTESPESAGASPHGVSSHG